MQCEGSGTLQIIGADETQSVFFEGSIEGDRIDLASTHIEVSGARTCACDISPPADSFVLITRPEPPPT